MSSVLHLEADSPAILLALARTAVDAMRGAQPATAVPPAPPAAPETPAAVAATLPAPAARTRKPRAAAPETPAPSAPAAVPPAPQGPGNDAPATGATAAPAAAAKLPTVDEVRAALSEVNSAFGMGVCTELLKAIGVDRVSMVPEDKRVQFIADCKAKAASKPA